jgi:PAS domain S-box-containing protein
LFYRRLETYAALAGLIMLCSLAVATVLSHNLQKRISGPVMALAETARMVSERSDYSVRAPRLSGDELGLLTDAFNQMLVRIQDQTNALQESEARKSAVMESALDAIIGMDMEGRVADFNPAAERLFGYPRAEAIGQLVGDLIVPEHLRQAHWRGLKHFLETGEGKVLGRRIEMPALRSDGTQFLAELSISAARLQNGKPFFTAYLRDITDQKRAQEERAFLAAIVESTDDAIIGKDLNGNIVSWNLGAERMFGYTAKEMIGHSVERIVSPDRPEEEQRILQQVKTGETHLYETIRIHKDGHPIHISLTVSPIRDVGGAIVGFSSIARDITERIQAQEALERHARTLREQAQMLDLANVMVRDVHDRIILWNTGMEKMYGWSRIETLGRLSYDILKTQFPLPIEQIRALLMRDGRWEGEVIHTRKDGAKITVSSQWVLHRDEKGQATAIIEVNTDITERKLAEQQMLRMNVELEQRVRARTAELSAANQEMEAFTYSVAHDLRAPLRHIDAFSKMLADDFSKILPLEAVRYLETIRRGSQNMSHLVDDLLNLARVGRQELKRELIPLNQLVDQVVAELDRETRNRDIEWNIAELPSVVGDPGLLKQIFVNLLSNAVKYSRPRARAMIEIGQEKKDGETIFYIRDNGVGFNMKYSDKLFGVFQRLHRAEEFEGTGVGLAIVDRVIRRHGGRIWAESEVDKGATFYFTLNGLQKTG